MKKSTLFPMKQPIDFGKKSGVPKEELEKLLNQCFGHERFRGKQLEAIQAVLSGRDCFCLMPTGGGKSMCYQIPALAKPGIVLVISPLIALMENQVAALKGRGIPAEYISSTQTASIKQKILEDLDSGKPSMSLLYVTPELIATLGFKSKLTKIHSRGLLSLIAIDEAHCISTWGHDFRPSYRKLSSLRSQLPGAPLLALTATAAPKVQKDVIESLGLQCPMVLRESFNRPNIFYEVRYKDLLDDVYLDIRKLIKSNGHACSIIYCLERSACDDLSAFLLKSGIPCAAYHAGLNNKARSAVLDDWISSKIQVVVATVAFGMGIDRKDVRMVCHYNIPKSMEAFYQESGRAGRDHLPSRSVLYYGLDDHRRMEFILHNAGSSKKPQSSSSSDDLLRNILANFFQIVKYCEGSGCRRKKILESFGEQVPTSLCQKACDACKHPEIVATHLGQLCNIQNVSQRSNFSPVFVRSSFDMVEDGGTEFWNREESESLDEDISDSDDGDEIVQNLTSKMPSRDLSKDSIDLLQRAEEIYYKKRDTIKQVGALSDKKVVTETIREASKQRLLNSLRQAQDRIGSSIPDLTTCSRILEMECYKKYGKVGKTFYYSQVANIIRWLSSSTYKDICDRLSYNSTQINCNMHPPVVSSSSQNCADRGATPTNDTKEENHACVQQETSLHHLHEELPLQSNASPKRNELHVPPIPSFTDFVEQKGKTDGLKDFGTSSKESSQSYVDTKKWISKDDAGKRMKLE